MKKLELKQANSLFAMLLIIMACFSFSSCGDDDDVDGNPSELIVGKWQGVSASGYFAYQGEKEEFNESISEQTITINSNGTGTTFDSEENERDEFQWTISGTTFTIKMEGEVQSAKVLKLNKSEMILEFHETDGVEEYYSKTTYKKI